MNFASICGELYCKDPSNPSSCNAVVAEEGTQGGNKKVSVESNVTMQQCNGTLEWSITKQYTYHTLFFYLPNSFDIIVFNLMHCIKEGVVSVFFYVFEQKLHGTCFLMFPVLSC